MAELKSQLANRGRGGSRGGGASRGGTTRSRDDVPTESAVPGAPVPAPIPTPVAVPPPVGGVGMMFPGGVVPKPSALKAAAASGAVAAPPVPDFPKPVRPAVAAVPAALTDSAASPRGRLASSRGGTTAARGGRAGQATDSSIPEPLVAPVPVPLPVPTPAAAVPVPLVAPRKAPAPPAPRKVAKPAVPKCRALYQNEAQNERELEFQEGDIIIILDRDDSGWWQGDLNGVLGWFPASYVEELPLEDSTQSDEQPSGDGESAAADGGYEQVEEVVEPPKPTLAEQLETIVTGPRLASPTRIVSPGRRPPTRGKKRGEGVTGLRDEDPIIVPADEPAPRVLAGRGAGDLSGVVGTSSPRGRMRPSASTSTVIGIVPVKAGTESDDASPFGRGAGGLKKRFPTPGGTPSGAAAEPPAPDNDVQPVGRRRTNTTTETVVPEDPAAALAALRKKRPPLSSAPAEAAESTEPTPTPIGPGLLRKTAAAPSTAPAEPVAAAVPEPAPAAVGAGLLRKSAAAAVAAPVDEEPAVVPVPVAPPRAPRKAPVPPEPAVVAVAAPTPAAAGPPPVPPAANKPTGSMSSEPAESERVVSPGRPIPKPAPASAVVETVATPAPAAAEEVSWRGSSSCGSFSSFCEELVDIATSVISSTPISKGVVSNVPALYAKTTNTADFAFAVHTLEGHVFAHGSTGSLFPLQQAVFPFVYAFALEDAASNTSRYVDLAAEQRASTDLATIVTDGAQRRTTHAFETPTALSLAPLMVPESPLPLRLHSVLSRLARTAQLAGVSCDLPIYLSYLQHGDELNAIAAVLVCLSLPHIYSSISVTLCG